MNVLLLFAFSTLFAVQDNPDVYQQNNLQATILHEIREAPVGVPLHYTFELKNMSKEEIILPLKGTEEFDIQVQGASGESLHHGGPMTSTTGGTFIIRLSAGETYLHSERLNTAFGHFYKAGTYKVHLLIEASGSYRTAELVNGTWLPTEKPCWKGRLQTADVIYSSTMPPTEEDMQIYNLLSQNGQYAIDKSFLGRREEIFSKYPETIYAALSILAGYFHKTERYPSEEDVLKFIAVKYSHTALAKIIEYTYAGFADQNKIDQKKQFYKSLIEKEKGTAWAAKAQRRLSWLEACEKDKASDACKYPPHPF